MGSSPTPGTRISKRILLCTILSTHPRDCVDVSFAPIAQLVEQLALNETVQGSNPCGCTKGMALKIIDARPEHAEGIQEVFYRAWLCTYPNADAGVTPDDIEDRFKDRHHSERIQMRKTDIETLSPDKKYLVAIDDEKVVALCRAEKSSGEQRLNAIYVLPECQGKGIGTTLWSEVKPFFEPTRDVVVGVATYNEQAISFYQKLGFIDSGRRFTEERLQLKSGANIPQMDMVLPAAHL